MAIVTLYRVDQTSGDELFVRRECFVSDVMDMDDPEYEATVEELHAEGRAYIGGGAAPLFVIRREA